MIERIDVRKNAFLYGRLFEHHRRLFEENIEFIFRRFFEQDARIRLDATLSRLINMQQCALEIFLPLGHAFSEEQCARAEYSAGSVQSVTVELGQAPPVTRGDLRLDPSCLPGVFYFDRLQARSARTGELVWDISGADLRQQSRARGTAELLPDTERVVCFSYGTDPQILIGPLDFTPETFPLTLTVSIRASTDLRDAVPSAPDKRTLRPTTAIPAVSPGDAAESERCVVAEEAARSTLRVAEHFAAARRPWLRRLITNALQWVRLVASPSNNGRRRFSYSVDGVTDDSVLGTTGIITGWVISSRRDAIVMVRLRAGGTTFGAHFPVLRPDIALLNPGIPRAEHSGFSLPFRLPPQRAARLVFEVLLSDGQWVEFATRTVRVGTHGP
jgi:hypothetical protein